MAHNDNAQTSHLEGRLFLDDGRLYFVINVDTASGIARVSCRVNGEQKVIEMSISDVTMRLSSSSKLDSLNTNETTSRIVEKNDGWFFTTREGFKGPYKTEAKATDALNKHILAAQEGASDADARRSANATCH